MMPSMKHLIVFSMLTWLSLNGQAAANDVLNVQPDDVIMGEKDAPVTIVEYASLSCGHCASFHEKILPGLKSKYIEPGKAKFIFRSFPLNAPALRGAMLTHCVADRDYYTFIEVMFDQQKAWAFDPNHVDMLGKIARLGGMSHDKFQACMENKELETQLIEAKKTAIEALEVRSTPTVFVNGTKVEAHDLEAIQAAIEASL
jgi:protein-disulfide isomerase